MARHPLIAISCALLIAFAALSGCVGPDLDDSEPPRGDWQRSPATWPTTTSQTPAPPPKPIGRLVEFDINTLDQAIATTDAKAWLKAPLRFTPSEIFPDDRRLLYFGDASTATLGPGIIILEGPEFVADQGTIGNLSVVSVRGGAAFTPTLHTELSLHVYERPADLPVAWNEALNASLFARQHTAQIEALNIASFDSGIWIGEDSWQPLEGSVTFSASAMAFGEDSGFEFNSARIQAASFAWTANETSGSWTVDGSAMPSAPDVLVGRNATLEIFPYQIRSLAPLRVTQAADDGVWIWKAVVQIKPTHPILEVRPGNPAWVEFTYAETSHHADALLRDIRINGLPYDVVEIGFSQPPSLMRHMLDLIGDVPLLARPFVALTLAAASPAIFLIDLLLAFFGPSCPEPCPERHPYPSWMDAGSSGRFFIHLNATQDVGDTDVTLVFEGQNHDPVTVSFVRRVG